MAENTTATAIPEVSVTEQAIQKLTEMLGRKPDGNKQTIISYLQGRVGESESLARDVLKDGKNWNGCWNFIYSMASKAPRTGGCACIEDGQVFEWAEDYFRTEEKPETKAAKTASKPAGKAPAKPKASAKPKEAAKTAEAAKPDEAVNAVSEEDVKDVGGGQKRAKRTLYFRTGDTYWKVDEGALIPTEDSLRDAERITEADYYKVMKPADMVLPEAEPAAKPKPEAKPKAEAKPKSEKKPAKKPKNEIEGQMSLFDIFGG